MNAKNTSIKLAFGAIIFAFALALAYFTASYLQSAGYLDYWLALEGFAGLFVLIGIMIATIFPVSLGFLFSACILIMHIFLEKYQIIPDSNKAILLGVILIILYLVALGKKQSASSAPVAAAVPPQQV